MRSKPVVSSSNLFSSPFRWFFVRAIVAIATLALCVRSNAGECDKLDKIPSTMQLVQSADFVVPSEPRLSGSWTGTVPAANTAAIELQHVGDDPSLYDVVTKIVPKSLGPVCTAVGALRDSDFVRYELTDFSNGLRVEVGAGPGSHFKINLYTSGSSGTSPDRPADPPKVGIPLNVFVLPGAPLASAVDDHLRVAKEIWAAAGVLLQARIRVVSQADAEKLMGKEVELRAYLGCFQRFSEGFERREALAKFKPKPDSLALFLVKSTGQSQAEPEFVQAYIAANPFGMPVGRMMAHEIGHLLLGYGHTGTLGRVSLCDRAAAEAPIQEKKAAPWTSGLMRDGETSNATDISADDARTARRRALTLPGAVWWTQ